jgi:peptide/nickel transport system substrate-binding protein
VSGKRKSARTRQAQVIRVLAATLAVALATVAPAAGAQQDGQGKLTFTVGITNDIDSMNPFLGYLAEAYEVWAVVYDQLTVYASKDFTPTPSLAESWTASPDGKTWTYKIRQGIRWSDGKPLTAKDVAYTFNRVKKGETEQTNYGTYVTHLESVTAPDDATVVMTTKVPTPVMTKLGVPILPEHVWKDVSDKEIGSFDNEKNVVGSGPFVFEERKTGQYVKLRANKQYWGGAPKFDELVFRVFNNKDAMVQALRKGEIDFADDLDANLFESLKNTEGITTVPARYPGFNQLGFNTGAALRTGEPIGDGHPALKDKRVRQAIARAVDKKTLVARVLRGYGSEAHSIIPSLFPKLHYVPGEGEALGFDLAAANQQLEEAGYRDTDGDKVREMPNGGRPLRFRLLARQESPNSQQAVKFIQGWLKEIGIDARTSVVEANRLTEILGQGDFDMFEWGWVPEPDPNSILAPFTCAQRSYKAAGGEITPGLSDSFYCNPAYDRLNDQQSQTVDANRRAELVKQMQAVLYQDAPYVVTYYYDDLQAYRGDRFVGFLPQPDPNGVLLFAWGAHSYTKIGPPQAAATASGGDGGSSLPVVLVGAVVVLAAVGGGLLLARRRSATRDERE